MSILKQKLDEARAINASDPERALSLRREVAVTAEVGPEWSVAHIDLASHELGHANYAAAAKHAKQVLDAPRDVVDPVARAVAGVLLASAQEVIGDAVDEDLLLEGISAARTNGANYYAGIGLSQRARLLLHVHGDRAAAKAAFEEAATLLDTTESAFAGPGTWLRLATLEHEDGEDERARGHVKVALDRLAQFPYAGQSGHVLRQKLLRLQEQIGST